MDQVYLTNNSNPDAAGYYDPGEAAVLLAHGVGWVEATPPVPEPVAAFDLRQTVSLINDTNPAGNGDYDAQTAAVLLAEGTGWRVAAVPLVPRASATTTTDGDSADNS